MGIPVRVGPILAGFRPGSVRIPVLSHPCWVSRFGSRFGVAEFPGSVPDPGRVRFGPIPVGFPGSVRERRWSSQNIQQRTETERGGGGGTGNSAPPGTPPRPPSIGDGDALSLISLQCWETPPLLRTPPLLGTPPGIVLGTPPAIDLGTPPHLDSDLGTPWGTPPDLGTPLGSPLGTPPISGTSPLLESLLETPNLGTPESLGTVLGSTPLLETPIEPLPLLETPNLRTPPDPSALLKSPLKTPSHTEPLPLLETPSLGPSTPLGTPIGPPSSLETPLGPSPLLETPSLRTPPDPPTLSNSPSKTPNLGTPSPSRPPRRKSRTPRRGADPRDPSFRGVTFSLRLGPLPSRADGGGGLLITAHRSFGAPRGPPAHRRPPKVRKGAGSSSEDERSAPPAPGPPPRSCASCKTQRTPLWRAAENGTPLCNACGIRYRKYRRRCRRCWSVPRRSALPPPAARCPQCGAEDPPRGGDVHMDPPQE
ncbi:GATA-type zinc finger protein 1 [Lagopus muta]|uniref:GATA-type zinc finger protein 1 n=1 Tax=Lagopus muta TaxID=64668 RepID=UPI00209E5A12|nr:GATA-type zinc finger protein 1 [Lagopus muta]